MIKDLLKWVVPGLATVLGGTTLCLAMASAEITGDLSARAGAAMTHAGYDWAELSFDMRDIRLAGTTTDTAILAEAVTRLQGLDGVRSVTSDVTLAPMASPYLLTAAVSEAGLDLSGGVPDETTRRNLIARAGLDQAALELRSGMPDRRAWTAGAQFAIDTARYFDDGAIAVSDLTVNIAGRARSEKDFRDLLVVLRAGPPAGLTMGEVDIVPPLVSPYLWNASSDGQRITVGGFVPDDATAERLRLADVAGLPVATGLALGSGESPAFATLSQTLLEQLAKLEHGAVSISGDDSTLTGAPPSREIAQAIVETLKPSGTIVVLEPPRIAEYWVNATRQADGRLVFDGYVPDEVTREAFAQYAGADTSFLELGRGAPDRYRAGADFGLAALDLMSEGRMALRQSVLSISGTARSQADYDALGTMLGEIPQGVELAEADIGPPRAAPYLWSATRNKDGAVALSGNVPSLDVEAALLQRAGPSATSSLTYASGEPTNFTDSATRALDLLSLLREGAIAFDGKGWTLTGTPGSPQDQSAIESRFTRDKLAAAGWSKALAQPEPEPAPEPAPTSPYTWSATRSETGVTLLGHVPDATAKAALVSAAGDGVEDRLAIGPGAPDGFAGSANAALAAILKLEEGEASFDGQTWSVMGVAASESIREETRAALSSDSRNGSWTIDIALREPAPPAPVTPYLWSVTKSVDGAIVAEGNAPAASFQRIMALRAGAALVDETVVSAGAPEGFVEDSLAGLAALPGLAAGTIGYDGSTWSVRGQLIDGGGSDVVGNAITSGATPPDEWTLELTPPPAAQPVPEPEPTVAETPVAPAVAAQPPEEAPAAGAAADIAACTVPVAQFSARNAIFFGSGAASIAAESDDALDELAIDLAACPRATVHIEGHTDSDGDEASNLALSVARAEAVVDALVRRGVSPDRLYAVGYGETSPIADNATAQGKRVNRRIVVTVKAGQ